MKSRFSGIALFAAAALTFLCSGCSASECASGTYVEYKPVFFNSAKSPLSSGSAFYIDETKVIPGHYINIRLVFDLENIKYKVVDNKVMVACEAWLNKNDMLDATAKANDKDYILFQKNFCLESPSLCHVSKQTLDLIK